MSTTITRPRRGLRRSLAGVMTTALAASGLALLPSAAHADPADTAPTLTWKISQQFVDHLSTRTVSGGASFDTETGFTFTGGVGYSDSGNGASTVAYQGTVKGAFVNGVNELYSVTIADPIVTVDGDGDGTVSAVVSSANAAFGPTAADSTGPARVVVTTFSADTADWTTSDSVRSLTATPAWDGVMTPGSQTATDLGITGGKPVEGRSFAPAFLGGIVPGVRAHFYDSGTGTSNPKKNPASFTARVGRPKTTVTATSATPSGGLALSIAGSGFTRATNPGDTGVYVGLAPSGGLPDTSQFDTSAFAAATWVMAPSIDETTGAFTSTLTAPTAKLDPATAYSLYTWRAHTHSTTSQDSETPVTIDFSKLAKKTSAPIIRSTASTHGQASTVTVTVPVVDGLTPSGSVTLSGAGTQTAALAQGSATFSIPSTLPAGTTSLTAAYAGDGNYTASSATSTLTVARAAVTVKRNKIAKKPTTTKSGKTSLTIRSTVPGTVTGKVTVTFTKKGQKAKRKTVTVKNGKAAVTIPKLAKGTWKIAVKYSGTPNLAPISASAGTVKVTKK